MKIGQDETPGDSGHMSNIAGSLYAGTLCIH